MRLPVWVLVSLLQLAKCLPIVDPGLFVILGVRSCRAGTGYCLLGLDCTLDEDFLPDDQGGHCDGLRSAFTPSAHFICCRYSAANGTLPPESPPLAAPVDLGQDVAENGLASLGDYFGTGGGGGQESDEGNLVQGAVGAAASLQTADDAPTEPSPLPSNGSPDIEDSSTAAVVTVSDAMYGQVSVAETTGFSGQFTEYATDMSEVVTTTAQSEDEATRLEHSGTASEEGTTATSVTESARQRQHEGPGPLSADASGSKLRPIQSRVGFDGPLLVLTDRGIVEARPSAIRAETEILVHGDDVGHSILELQSRDDASALATFHTSESSGGHADTTTTEAYPAVTASEGSGTPVTASLQSVPEDTAAPATGTTVSSGDTTLLPDISLDLVAGSQRRTSPSVPAPELDNSLLDTATGTAMRTAQDSTPSKREHVVSESASTKDRRVSGEEPTTATEGNKHTPTQILLQLAPGSRSPPAEGESELSKNALQISETSHETPGTIRTEMSVDEVTTPSWEHDGTAETRPEPSLGETVSRPGDCDERGAPTATEADGEGSEPTAVAPQPSAGGAAGQTFAEVTALPSGMETTAAAAEQLHQPRPGAAPPATAVAAEVAVAGASEATALGNASPATQQPAHHSPLCGIATPGRPGGAQCWLVQFVGANSSSSPVCVGSYLDATTIVTSAACISRVLDVGVAQVTMVSAGGAVTSYTRIRDLAVHEEYRQHGAQLLLNDIGLLRMRPASPMPPAACAVCLPSSDRDLLGRSCDWTSLGQSVERDPQIGSPLVCGGGVLAGIASYFNPGPVYTPVTDYVTWIETNRQTHGSPDDAWT